MIKSANCMKGAGIIAIVMIHALFQCATGDELVADAPYSTNAFFEIFYSGLMMLFLLSGYFYKPHSGYWKNLKKRIIQIVPPFLICGLVLTVFMGFWGNIYGYYSSVQDILDALVYTITCNAFQVPMTSDFEYALICTGWYYLMTALGSMIIFYAIADWIRENWKRLVAVVAILICMAALIKEFIPVQLPLRFDIVPFALSFMLIGTYMNKHEILPLLENGWKTKKYWLLLIPFAVVGILFAFFFPSTLQFSDNVYGEYGSLSAFTYFILALCGGYVLLALCGIVSKINILTKFLTYISRYIMFILLLHAFFIKLLATPFFGMTHEIYFPAMPLWAQVLFGILSIVLSIITTNISFKVYYAIKPRIMDKITHNSA